LFQVGGSIGDQIKERIGDHIVKANLLNTGFTGPDQYIWLLKYLWNSQANEGLQRFRTILENLGQKVSVDLIDSSLCAQRFVANNNMEHL